MVGLSVGGWSFICGIRFGSELATLRPLSSHREVDSSGFCFLWPGLAQPMETLFFALAVKTGKGQKCPGTHDFHTLQSEDGEQASKTGTSHCLGRWLSRRSVITPIAFEIVVAR